MSIFWPWNRLRWWILGFEIHFLIPNKNINLKKLKNVDFQNSSIKWSMKPCHTDHEEMSTFWPWNRLRRWILGFEIQFLILNQNFNLKKLENVDFQNSSIRWNITPCRTDHEDMHIYWRWNHLRRWILGF